MVTVVNYRQQTNQEGQPFFALELQGDLEMVQSNATGKYYATARSVSIPTTFNENMCVSLVGREIPGTIQKKECEPYAYTIPSTGEQVELNYSWTYVPE